MAKGPLKLSPHDTTSSGSTRQPTAPYLAWTNRRTDDKCWFCAKAPRQTREHLFKNCARWRKEHVTLWTTVEEAMNREGKTERGRKKVSTPIKVLLADDRCTEAVLDFLASTQVGTWPEKLRTLRTMCFVSYLDYEFPSSLMSDTLSLTYISYHFLQRHTRL